MPHLMHETTFLKSHHSSKLTSEFQEVEKFEGNFAQSCKVSDRSEDPWMGSGFWTTADRGRGVRNWPKSAGRLLGKLLYRACLGVRFLDL